MDAVQFSRVRGIGEALHLAGVVLQRRKKRILIAGLPQLLQAGQALGGKRLDFIGKGQEQLRQIHGVAARGGLG